MWPHFLGPYPVRPENNDMSHTPLEKKNSLPSRPVASLGKRLTKNLKDYASAAAAAGVGMMVLAQTGEAKIVYTPTNTGVGGPTPIDLNNDGFADFTIQQWCCGQHSVILAVKPTIAGNSIRPNGGTSFYAAAGFFGVPVGPGGKFAVGSSYLGLRMATAGSYGGGSQWFIGPWANAVNRYLGMKFQINGQTHYGWARLSVANFIHGGAVVITGYAYETVANRKILEGHVSGPASVSEIIEPNRLTAPGRSAGSLSALALGAPGLSIWRRED